MSAGHDQSVANDARQGAQVATTPEREVPGRRTQVEGEHVETHQRAAGAASGPRPAPQSTLHVRVTHKQEVRHHNDSGRGAGAELAHVAHATRAAIDPLARARKHVVKANAPHAAASHGKHASIFHAFAPAPAAAAHAEPHAAPAAHPAVHVPATGATGGDAGAIHLKPISMWDRFLPQHANVDAKQRQQLVAHVKTDITAKRQQSAALLENLRTSQLAAAVSVRGQLPALQTRIASSKIAATSRIATSEQTRSAALIAQVAGLQAQVGAGAAASTARAEVAHIAAITAITSAKQKALQMLSAAQASALARVDQAATDQVAHVGTQFASTRDAITGVANEKSAAAVAKADTHAFQYDGDKLNAARDAAHTVAHAWADQMPAQGAKAYEQIASEQPNCTNGVGTMASEQRQHINATFEQCRQALEDAVRTAMESAAQIRTQTLSQLGSTSASTNAQLEAHKAAQLGAVRHAAMLARADVDGSSARTLSSLTALASKAAAGIDAGAASLARAAHHLETPDPHATGEQVSRALGNLQRSEQSVTNQLHTSTDTSATALAGQADAAGSTIDHISASAAQTATTVGTGALASLGHIDAGATTGLAHLSTNASASADSIANQGTTALSGLVTGLLQAFGQSSNHLAGALGGSVRNVASSFDAAINGDEDKQIQDEGDKAAANVKPWWQQALAVVVSIVVSIAVVVVITALIATTGPIGMILVGAAAGALGSVLGAMASNLVLGNDIMANVTIETAITGAIGGAIGAGFTSIISAGVNKFGSAALQAMMRGSGGVEGWAVRTGVDVANNMATDAATQLITTGTYQLDMTNLVTTLITSSITSTGRYDQGQSGIVDAIRDRVPYLQLGSAGNPLSLRPTLHKPEGQPVRAPLIAEAPATSATQTDGQPAARQPTDETPAHRTDWVSPLDHEMTPAELASAPTAPVKEPSIGADGEPRAIKPTAETAAHPAEWISPLDHVMTPEELASAPAAPIKEPSIGADGEPRAIKPTTETAAHPAEWISPLDHQMTPAELASAPAAPQAHAPQTSIGADGQPLAVKPTADVSRTQPAAWEPPPVAPIEQGWQPPARGPVADPAGPTQATTPATAPQSTELAARAPAPATTPVTPVTIDRTVTPAMIVEKSGLTPDVIKTLDGNPRLARFTDAVTSLVEARARFEEIKATKPSYTTTYQDASTAVSAASSEVTFQKELLAGAAKQVAAKVAWQTRIEEGKVDFGTVAQQGSERIAGMYDRASAEMDAAARSVVDYRVGQVSSQYPSSAFPLANSDFSFDMQRMGSGEPLNRMSRAVGLLADAEDGAALGTARYNHLKELQQRGIRIVVDDPDFSSQWSSRSPQAQGSQRRFAYYFAEGQVHIRDVRLDATANTTAIPSNARIVTEDSPLSTAGGTRAYIDLVRGILGH